MREIERRLRRLEAARRADSTENAGEVQGVRSHRTAEEIEETAGLVLTADGSDGSVWAEGGGGGGGGQPFPEVVAAIGATCPLLGYWRLGDAGSPFLDTSGHAGGPVNMIRTFAGVAMSLDVAGALPAGDDDGAVEFNAGDTTLGDWLNATDTRLAGAVSAGAWVRPTEAAGAQGRQAFGNWTPFNGGYAFWQTTTGTGFVWGGTGGNASFVGPPLPLNEWTFVVLVTRAVNLREMYFDGALVAQSTQLYGAEAWPNLMLGKSSTGALARAFKGGVDEVTAWGCALSVADIAALAEAGGVPSGRETVVLTSTNYAASAGDTILASGTITITLPTAVGIAGQRIQVKNTDTGTITVARTASQTIDGASANVSMAVSKMEREFVSDGVGWQITKGYL